MVSHVDGRIKLCPGCGRYYNERTRAIIPELAHIKVEHVDNKGLCAGCDRSQQAEQKKAAERELWATTTKVKEAP